MSEDRHPNPDSERPRPMVRPWEYKSAMVFSVVGRLMFATSLFAGAEVPVSRILFLVSALCVNTMIAAAIQKRRGRIYENIGVLVAVFSSDCYLLQSLFGKLDLAAEDSKPFMLVVAIYLSVFLVIWVWKSRILSERTPRGLLLSAAAMMFFVTQVGNVCTAVLGALAGDLCDSSVTNKCCIRTRARLGRGCDYVVDYQVASVFYSQYAIIAALAGTRLQETMVTSIVAAFGVLLLPAVFSLGDGMQCFSLRAALTGVVGVECVDALLTGAGEQCKYILEEAVFCESDADGRSGNRTESPSQSSDRVVLGFDDLDACLPEDGMDLQVEANRSSKNHLRELQYSISDDNPVTSHRKEN